MRVDTGQTKHPYVHGAVRILSPPINAKSSYWNLAIKHITKTLPSHMDRDENIIDLFILIELGCVSMVEQDGFEHSPNLLITPMFAHGVSHHIVLPFQESKVDEP